MPLWLFTFSPSLPFADCASLGFALSASLAFADCPSFGLSHFLPLWIRFPCLPDFFAHTVVEAIAKNPARAPKAPAFCGTQCKTALQCGDRELLVP